MSIGMFPSKSLWFSVVSLFVIDILWITQSSFSLVWQWRFFLSVLIVFGILSSVAWFYTKHRNEPCFVMLAVSIIYMILLMNSAAIYSYLISSINLPLLDADLAAVDAGMGFDWLAFLSWVNEHPLLGQALTWSYRSSLLQIFFILLLLSFKQHRTRLSEFLVLYTTTMLVIVTLAGFLPAEGAYAFHEPSAELFANLNSKAGMWHYNDFTGLRDGTFRIIDITKITGIVTFPSFHTALAIVAAYSMRGIRFVFPAMIALNTMVIISTLSEGGHYLIDVLIGGILAICAIFVLRMMRKSVFKTDPLLAQTT
jgi:membrane-associated phospholipid phosphatase